MARQRFDQSRYGSPAPWWFRNTLLLLWPLSVPLVIAGSQQRFGLLLATLVVVVLAGVVIFGWERRHRIR